MEHVFPLVHHWVTRRREKWLVAKNYPVTALTRFNG